MKARARQRAGGENRRPFGKIVDLTALDGDPRVTLDGLGHPVGEAIPIHRQGTTSRYGRRPRNSDHEGIKDLHFTLEQSHCVAEHITAKRVRANKLG